GPGRIAGAVVSETGAPLVSAAVTLLAASDSTAVAEALTSEQGRFRIQDLPLGRYLVRVTYLGYAPHTSAGVVLTAASPAADLGTVQLVPDAIALDAIEAEAERSPVILEADRTVYDAKQMAAAAGNATDVLRSVPELEVDVNGNVTLRGGQAVAIHLNGRPAPLKGDALTNLLQQLPGNRRSEERRVVKECI